MPATDLYALKLTRALQTYDLDSLVAQVKDHLKWPPKQLRSNLNLIFQHAQQDHLNLLHPPADFQQWLQTPLRETVNGPGTASSSTINARLSTLTMLYEHLIDQGLLLQHPLRGLERPAFSRSPTAPPPGDDLQRLLAHSQQDDPTLYAALLLLTRHAVYVTEILSRRWTDVDFPRGLLLRRKGVITLDQDTLHALDHLRQKVGGPLFESSARIFPYDHQDALRSKLFQMSLKANVKFIGPAQLRKVALQSALPVLTEGQPDQRVQHLAETLAKRKTLPNKRMETKPDRPEKGP